ncbi:MAG: glycosyltransferase family 4 protein [Candidatus Omnitrophota bacterium]
MKILFITTHLNYGGITTYIISLAEALSKKGHNVYIASAGGDLAPKLEKSDVRHVRIPIKTKCEFNPLLLIALIKLLYLIRKESIDIIHAQTRVTQVVAAILSVMAKVPYLTTCHGFFKPNLGRQFFPCWGRKVVAISDAVEKHLKIDFYLPDDQIALIPNGIDIGRFVVSARRDDIKVPVRKVGIIARLSYVKGHRYLLEAMAEVIREFSDARLFIFGDGKIKNELIKQAQKLAITDKVIFLPAVFNTAEVLQEIDVFVMPSLQEGLGLSILEAQACGLPVIASCVGGIPTIIKDNLTGLLVSPRDARALAGAILKVMDNKDLAIRLGRCAREQVEYKFNLTQVAGQIEEIYKELLVKPDDKQK